MLGVAFALVFVIARWLTGGSDGKDDAPVAEQVGARVAATETVTVGESTAAVTTGPKAASARPTLAAPEGPCDPADVVVVPSVAKGAEAGADVTLMLSLQTVESEACTWQVASDSVVVNIAEDGRQLWTTRQCPRAVPGQAVVVRRTVATVVELVWNARESAAGCSRRTAWVLPGDFTISAAALGGEPATAEFTLSRPAARTVSVTPEPKPTATPTKKPKRPVN